MEKLCPTDPAVLYVAVPGRIRRQLGRGVVVKNGADTSKVKPLHGIPSQNIGDAIRSSCGIIMNGRLIDAANRAREQGLLLADTCEQLIQELNHVVKENEGWDILYANARHDLPVLETSAEAVAWANELIRKIDESAES